MPATLKHFVDTHPNITTIILLVVLIVGVQVFFGSQATPLDGPADLQTILTNGRPTLIEFYSNL